MGVESGAQTLHHLKHLTRADIAEIARGLYEERRTDEGFNMAQPTIDGDSNNVCYVVAMKSCSKSEKVAAFYNDWAQCGLAVIPVTDGDVRPTCKQASNLRIADREKERIQSFIIMAEANKKKREISSAYGSFTASELVQMNKDIKDMEKKSRTKLSRSENIMPADFAEALEDVIVNDICARTKNGSGGYIGSVLKASFQADAAIVQRFLSKESLMAFTNDSDIPIVAGDDFIAVKEYKMDGKMTLVSTCKTTLERVVNYLPDGSNAKLEEAVCPLFENVSSRKLRALIMVALGCDVYKPGVVGFGPKTLLSYMDKLRSEMKEQDRGDEEKFFGILLKLVGKKSKLGVEVIETFVEGIIYEPTNCTSCEAIGDDELIITEADYTYFDGAPPSTLPEYLCDMAHADTTVTAGTHVLQCKGAGQRCHLFLAKTGWSRCHSCNATVCSLCCGSLNDKSYCLLCFATESLVPSRDGGFMERIASMRKALADDFNHDGTNDLSVADVEEAYEIALSSVQNHKDLGQIVKYPLYRTSELKHPTKWKQIYQLQFCKGGTFVTEPSLRQHVPALLHLFASFVKYERKKYTEWVKDPAVYDALPSMIIKFAQNSRIDSGYRLLERCVRHGHDPRMKSLFDNSADIIQLEDGTLGMAINAKVPASMKKDIYDSAIALTADDILAVECSCKSGSKDDEKGKDDRDVVCVHNNPIAYKVTELLLEDLAEHILVELASCISSLMEMETWIPETERYVKGSVILLMEAAGEQIDDESKKMMSLTALLDRFLTGTEKNKAWGRRKAQSRPSEQGPIEKLSYDSPAKKAKMLQESNKKMRTQNQDRSDDADDDDVDLPSPPNITSTSSANYLQSVLLMDCAGIDASTFSPVGFKLLTLRSKTEMHSMGTSDLLALRAKLGSDWKDLDTAAKERSFRTSGSHLDNLSKAHSGSKRTADTDHTPLTNNPSTPAPMNTPPPKSKKQRRLGQGLPITQDWTNSPKPRKAKPPKPKPRNAKPPKAKPPKPKSPKPANHWSKIHSRCSRLGCNVTNVSHPNTHFHRIKAFPKELSKNASKKRFIEREGKIVLRQEILDRCHFKRGVKGGAYRICEEHEFEWAVRPRTFKWKGKNMTQLFNLYVPKGDGCNSHACMETKKVSCGMPIDRMIRKNLEELNKQIGNKAKPSVTTELPTNLHSDSPDAGQSSDEHSKVAAATADAAESRKLVQQMVELSSQEPTPLKINASVAQEAGLLCDERESPPVQTPNKTFFNSEVRITPRSNEKTTRIFVKSQPPILHPQLDGSNDAKVKRTTGFPNEAMMIAFIISVCGGDAKLVMERRTSLTWYEEWYFFFEFEWGRTLTRWQDAKAKYGPEPKYLRSIYRHKIALLRRAHLLWPKFASYEEDRQLRKPKWESKYGEKNGVKTRPVMWDMTGIKAYQFGAADLQRDTYSKYYAGNCMKGGIFCQLCSWMGVHDLWGGNVSDTDYHNNSGYLEEQEEYQKKDMVDDKVVPFTVILDKGYRARAANLRRGGQLTLQPVYAKSDQRFKGSETMLSASVASDRGGNERAVNVSKRGGVIKRGFKPSMDAKMFQDSWIGWGFQMNFMYNPVL